MTSLVKAALLGILQGLTEFLPISSTAHLIIVGRLLAYDDPGGVFKVMIQLGSILAVMWLYRDRILEVVAGLGTEPDAQRFALMLLVAFLPSLLAGAFLAGFVKTVFYASLTVIAVAFVLGGTCHPIVERVRPAPQISEAAQTPLAQAIGMDCSRRWRWSRASRERAPPHRRHAPRTRPPGARNSPSSGDATMIAAFVHDLFEVRNNSRRGWNRDWVGFVMAFVAAALVIRPFLGFVSRSGLVPSRGTASAPAWR